MEGVGRELHGGCMEGVGGVHAGGMEHAGPAGGVALSVLPVGVGKKGHMQCGMCEERVLLLNELLRGAAGGLYPRCLCSARFASSVRDLLRSDLSCSPATACCSSMQARAQVQAVEGAPVNEC